jgi:hypothetical protein
MTAWLTPQDVSAHLGNDATDDARVERATAAVRAHVERLRSDLDFTDSTTVPDDVRHGSVLWAALLFQHRSAPSGFAGFGDGGDLLGDVLGSRKADIYRLIGLRRPVAI